jgi:hypothetical protein
MFNAIRILTALILSFSVPLAAERHSAHRTTAGQASATPVVFVGFTPAEQTAGEHTVSLFAQAGLPLPQLEIRRHHSFEPCNGFQGLHRRFDQRSVIDICTVEVGDFEQRTLLHELGHAWTEHFLSAGAKQAFQTLRDNTAWLDYAHVKWEDNGAEQAAEIITWALSEQPTPVVKIHRNSCDDLHDGYTTLTGLEPLHGYTKLCEPSTSTTNRS